MIFGWTDDLLRSRERELRDANERKRRWRDAIERGRERGDANRRSSSGALRDGLRRMRRSGEAVSPERRPRRAA